MARNPKPSGRKRPSFDTSLDRPVGIRRSAERLLVVCGAAVTERDYLNGLKSSVRNQAVSVKIVERPRAPSQVVAYAKVLQDKAPGEYDQTWCVLDVDEFTDLGEAEAMARRMNRTHIAWSNPCFELWLLLHFADHHAHAPDCDHLIRLLDKHVAGGYGKNDLSFRHYEPHWRRATERARAHALFGREALINPATGVWRLALEIAGEEPESEDRAPRRS